jgi:hypothetical protein
MLGCSIGNSKSQLHKARIRLLNLLRRAAVIQARLVSPAAACNPCGRAPPPCPVRFLYPRWGAPLPTLGVPS